MLKTLFTQQQGSTTPPNTPPVPQLKKSILKENGTPAKGNSVRFFSRDASSIDKTKEKENNFASLDLLANSPNPFSRAVPANPPNTTITDDSLQIENVKDIPRSSPAKLKKSTNGDIDIERVILLEEVVNALKYELEVEKERHHSSQEEVQRLSDVLDNNDVENQLKLMQKSYQSLKEKITSKIQQHESEIENYNEKIRQLELSNQSVESTNQMLSTTNLTLESENISYKESISELQETKKDLEINLDQLRSEHTNAVNARDEERAHSDNLAVKLNDLQTKLEELQNVIASRSNEQMLNQLKQLKDNSLKEIIELQTELTRQREKSEAQIATLQNQLNESLDEQIKHEHKNSTLNNQLNEMENELRSADEAIAEASNTHEVQLNTLRNELFSLQQQQQQQHNPDPELYEELESLRIHSVNLERELQDTHRQLSQERSQYGSLPEKFTQLQAERDNLEELNEGLEKAHIRLQKELTGSGKFHDQAHIIEKLTKDLERYKQAHNNDQVVISKLQDDNTRLNTDFENIKIALQAKQQEVHSVRRISGVQKLLTADDTINTSRRTSRRSSGFGRPSRPSLLRQESTPSQEDRPSEVLRRSVTTPSTTVPPRPPTLMAGRRRQSENMRTFLGSSTSTVKPLNHRVEIIEPDSPPVNDTHSSIMSYGQNQDIRSPSFVNNTQDAHSELEKMATSELSFDSSTPSLPEPSEQLSFDVDI